ncbi:unnamed protein product, partial [Ixodes pacificus]
MGTYGGGFVLGDELNIGQNHLVIRGCMMFPLLLVCVLVALCTDACPTPEIPKNGKSVLRMPTKALPTETSSYPTGTTVVYTCDADFDLMGPQHRRCHDDGLWHPRSLPFCLSDVTGSLPTVQSSASNVGVEASFAVDGNKSTCASTKAQHSPWLAVDLQDVFPITVVKLNFFDATMPSAVHATVRVGNSTRAYVHNAVCSVFKGTHAGQSVYLPCPVAVHGRHVSVHLHGTASLSVCEFVAYSEVARPE